MRFRQPARRLLRVLIPALFAAASSTPAAAGDTVVLLHGLGRTPLAMKRIERDLTRAGYDVRNLGYASQRHDLATLAETTLGPVFENPPPPDSGRIHVVTHSMGGMLVRQYLHDHGVPPSLGRVVMLAPPNAGSELVDRLRTWSLYRWLNGAAGLQLGTDAAGAPSLLGAPPPGVEIGVIAGDVSLNPLFSAFIGGPDDGKVSVARTHLAGESAHLTVPYSHTWMMWRGPVLVEIRAFLRTGRFTPPASAPDRI